MVWKISTCKVFQGQLAWRTRYDQWRNNRHSFLIGKINAVISLLAIPRLPTDATVLTCNRKLLSCSFKNVNKNREKRMLDGSAFACGAERTLRNYNSILSDVSRVDGKQRGISVNQVRQNMYRSCLYFPAHFCCMSVHKNSIKPNAGEECQYRC